MKAALVIRHVPHEDVAGFEAPIAAAGYALGRIDATDPGFGEADLLAPDLLVLMGGAMGVYERAAHPWIGPELDRLAARIERGLPTLGVCLGAQMIAAAMGAAVYRGPAAEIGFGPVALSSAGAVSPLRHVAGVPMLHWHGDTFDLPEGVELLASTAPYPHQAFRRGPALLALQFHAEMGEDPHFEQWLAGADEERRPALRADYRALGPGAVRAGEAMLAEWLGEL